MMYCLYQVRRNGNVVVLRWKYWVGDCELEQEIGEMETRYSGSAELTPAS